MYGLGDSITSASLIPLTGCNWVDDFGDCITGLLPGQSINTPASGVTVQVTPEGSRYFQTATGKEIFKSGGGFTDFVNKNATMIGIVAAAAIGLMFLSKR